MSTNGFNQQTADAFTEKMVDVLNYGALSLMTSIGHRTGLFDTMATLPPVTIGQIAEAADLHERYVREWLGAMVVGRIVEYNPETIPIACLRKHAADCSAALIAAYQYIGLFG
jgi:hypothetical protein